jgi:hypothetical protein
VEVAVRARRLLPEESSAEILWAALAEVIDPAQADRVVGWYRTHALTGVYLSEQEARLQETRFGEPWQCAVILAGTPEHPVGGVFQRTETGALSRSGYAAFFELIDPSSEFAPGWKRTFAGWSNYQTDLSVALAGKAGVSSVIPSDPEATQEARETDSDGPVPSEPGADRAPAPIEPLERTSSPPREAPGAEVDPVPVVHPAPGPTVHAAPTPTAEAAPVSADATDETDQAEESWSEVQIRRSLSAVGRTLGPSAATGLGAQLPTPDASPVELEDEEATTAPPDPISAEPRDAAPTAAAPASRATSTESVRKEPIGSVPATPEPVRSQRVPPDSVQLPPVSSEYIGLEPPDAQASFDSIETLVGGSRRKSRIPVRTVALAATGLVALLGSGWLVLERLGGARDASAREDAPLPVATGELPTTQDRDASMAGVTLGQGPLFPRGSGALETAEAEFLWVGPEMPAAAITADAITAEGDSSFTGGASATEEALQSDREGLGATGPADPALEEAPPQATPATATPEQDAAASADSQRENTPAAESPSADAAPAVAAAVDTSVLLRLEGLQLDDPTVAAFEDAFTIFRKEVTRYDSLRIAFDDLLAGCNALNLSYRAVRDAYRRLGSRFEAARDQFAGPGIQAYRSAGRQATVIDVHYELSECPPPRGG